MSFKFLIPCLIATGLLATGYSSSLTALGGFFSRPSVNLQNLESVSLSRGVAGASRAQRHNMHTCFRDQINPTNLALGMIGGVVTGVRYDRDELLCSSPFRVGQEVQVPASLTPNGDVMCPDNHFVTGVQGDRREASCAPLLFENLTRVPLTTLPQTDPAGGAATVRQDMHACPYGSGLVGFNTNIAAWTFYCKKFPICWHITGRGPTPCTNKCTLPPGTGTRQGTCS